MLNIICLLIGVFSFFPAWTLDKEAYSAEEALIAFCSIIIGGFVCIFIIELVDKVFKPVRGFAPAGMFVIGCFIGTGILAYITLGG